MFRRVALVLITALLFACFPAAGRADDLRALQLLTGVLTFPGAADRVTTIGALPKDGLSIPQPTGLAIVGSVASYVKGAITAEAIVYAAPEGSVPDAQTYVELLNGAGWHSQFNMPPSVFRMGTAFGQFCGKQLPALSVQFAERYLVVRAFKNGGGMCNQPGLPGAAPARRLPSPFPEFSAPAGAAFLSTSKTTYYTNGEVASVGITSSSDPATVLAGFAQQMTAAGWAMQQREAPAPADAGVSTVRKDGAPWVAVLTVVEIAQGTDVFTASAFKESETQAVASFRAGLGEGYP